jgi:hypothetical protein
VDHEDKLLVRTIGGAVLRVTRPHAASRRVGCAVCTGDCPGVSPGSGGLTAWAEVL